MKRIAIVCLTVLALSGFGALAQTPASTCSNATLNGAYGVQISGTRPAPAVLPNSLFLPGAMEQVVGVVIQIFDGQGNFTQTDNVHGSISGTIPNRPGAGTYSVEADCTGTYTINNKGVPFAIVTKMVVVAGGAQFHAVVVSPQPVMILANGSKI